MYIEDCLLDTYECSLKVDGKLFNSVSQYVLYQRARCEGNQRLANKIINTNGIEGLNKLKASFSPESNYWKKLSDDFRFRAVLNKFRYNRYLRGCLYDVNIASLQGIEDARLDVDILGSVQAILKSE